MTTDEIKDFLRGYQRAKSRYRELLERIKELEAMLTSISIDYSAEKVQTPPSDMAEKIAKLSDLRTDYINACHDAAEKMAEICAVIDKVDGVQGEILHRRYIEGKRWEEIAVEMHYTYRNVTYLHGKALLQVSKHI